MYLIPYFTLEIFIIIRYQHCPFLVLHALPLCIDSMVHSVTYINLCIVIIWYRAGQYTNFKDGMVFYKISNYHGIWLTQMKTFIHPAKYSSNLSQATSVYKQYQESDTSS